MAKTTMSSRERFVNCALGSPTDRGVFHQDGYWGDTYERWKREGMADGYDFGYDFMIGESFSCLPVSYGYIPGFEYTVFEDAGDKLRVLDEYGVEKYVMKSNTNLQQFLKYPVTCKKDWEKLKAALTPTRPAALLKAGK